MSTKVLSASVAHKRGRDDVDPPPPPSSSSSSPFVSIHRHLSNMGSSLRCPLCLSTLRDTPVLLPCVHAFCRECLERHLSSSSARRPCCPVCKGPASRRAARPSEHLRDLASAYRDCLRSFGLVPVVRDEAVLGLTQPAALSASSASEAETCERARLSKAWYRELRDADAVDARERTLLDWARDHQEEVVESNERVARKNDAREKQRKKEDVEEDEERGATETKPDEQASASHKRKSFDVPCSTSSPAKKPKTPDSTTTVKNDNDKNHARIVATPPKSRTTFAVGDVVEVEPRTWPGSNRPGGVARITTVLAVDHCYHVAYVLGGKERYVDEMYVRSTATNDVDRDHHHKNNDDEGIVRSSRRRRSRPSPRGKENVGNEQRRSIHKTLPADTHHLHQTNDHQTEEKVAPNNNNNNDSDKPTLEPCENAVGDTATTSDDDNVSAEIRKASERYCAERIQNAIQSGVVRVLLSSLSEYDMDLVNALVAEAKKRGVTVRVLKEFSPKRPPDLCLTSTVPGSPFVARARTLKTMRCALAAVPLFDVAACADSALRAGDLFPTLRVVDTLPRRDGPPSTRGALRRYHCRAPLLPLRGRRAILCGPSWGTGSGRSGGDKHKHDAIVLLRECGAVVRRTLRDDDNETDGDATTTVLLCDDAEDAVPPRLEAAVRKRRSPRGVTIVGRSWLFDCVSRGAASGAEDHPPAGKGPRALWRWSLNESAAEER